MGAVVGGLYASGFSAADIERVMTSVDWQDAFRDRPARKDLNFRRKLEDQNFLVKFPLGLKSRKFRLPRGLVQGQKLTQILRSLTLPVSQIQDFDDLAIPFRAIATDIVTGERVVLDHGDLTTAMRASLSAPGVFAPVESEGRHAGGRRAFLESADRRGARNGCRRAHRGRLRISAAGARQAELGGRGLEPDAGDPHPPQHHARSARRWASAT